MFFESPLQILIRQLLHLGAKTGWKLSLMGLAKCLYSHSYVSPLWKYGGFEDDDFLGRSAAMQKCRHAALPEIFIYFLADTVE